MIVGLRVDRETLVFISLNFQKIVVLMFFEILTSIKVIVNQNNLI